MSKQVRREQGPEIDPILDDINDAIGMDSSNSFLEYNKFASNKQRRAFIELFQSHTANSNPHHDEKGRFTDGSGSGEGVSKTTSDTFKLPDGYSPPVTKDKGEGVNGPNHSLSSEARPNLTHGEATAITDYTKGSYRNINKGLREGNIDPKSTATHTELQSAFAKAVPLESPVEVHRGINFDRPEQVEKFITAAREAQAGGKEVHMNGYVSTTTATGLRDFDGNVRLEIMARKGLDTSPYTSYPYEKEFLLDHGSRFKIHSIEKQASLSGAPGGTHVIKMEQLL